MELNVLRCVFTPTTTLGKMYLNDEFFAYTLEDAVRNLGPDGRGKVQNETAIGYGRYEVVLNYSNRFQRYLPLLLNVPFFTGVRIHGGNTCADSEGCILIGSDSDQKTRIWNCASKVNALVTALKGAEKKEKIWVSVEKAATASFDETPSKVFMRKTASVY